MKRNELIEILKERGTVKQAAEAMGISRQYLYMLASNPALHCGYYTAAIIEKYTNRKIKIEQLVNPAKKRAFDESLSS